MGARDQDLGPGLWEWGPLSLARWGSGSHGMQLAAALVQRAQLSHGCSVCCVLHMLGSVVVCRATLGSPPHHGPSQSPALPACLQPPCPALLSSPLDEPPALAWRAEADRDSPLAGVKPACPGSLPA